MDEVKDDKSTVSVSNEPAETDSAKAGASSADKNDSPDGENESAESGSSSASANENKSESPAAAPQTPAPAPAPLAETPATFQRIVPTEDEKESELIALNGLLLVALAGGMFYVGTVLFAKDSLLFFAGIFVYLIIAPPGTYVKGKSKMATFTKEVAMAFGLSFVLYLVFKAVPFATDDQAKFLIFILFILGVKLVFNPYYNFKQDDD